MRNILCFVIAALIISRPVAAEDIDLFSGAGSSVNDLPNVLMVVDNTANWGSGNNAQPFGNEKAALSSTFANLPAGTDGSAKFRVGIMFAAETGSPNNSTGGGVVRAAIRPMTNANKTKYAALINSLDSNDDKGNGGSSALMMAEAYRYFKGGTPYSGNSKLKADFTGNLCTLCNITAANKLLNAAVWSTEGNALSSMYATTYNSPVSNGCGKNYIIYLSNGPSQDNASETTVANQQLADAGGINTQITLSPAGSESNASDEWARFMKQDALGVTVYTIDVNPSSSGQGPGWTALLKNMAALTGGKYIKVVSSNDGGASIGAAVNKALSEIQSVNSVFASVSLPVSVNTQGTYLNQVFVGMFRPDGNAFPRWAGNLKQYKLALESNALHLADADDDGAINPLTGFIAECARSYWTPTTADSYWSFAPKGACIPPSGTPADYYLNSNFPDGNVVEKGAAGGVLRQATTRTVKTCAANTCSSLTDFGTSNSAITQASLGAGSATERDALINWAIGADLDDERPNSNFTEMRPSVHSDVVHSRPVAVNLGSDASPKVVVFYGGNDGILRAINGNRTDAITSKQPGEELWSFMAPEFYGRIKRIRDNTTQVSFPNVPATNVPTPQPKDYGFDGAITAYRPDANSAWVYATMRRGGRAVYAFNVSTANPANITLKWRVGCDQSGANCSTNMSGIGQTWSAPKVFAASGEGGGSTPLLIFGGGYDSCEDSDPNTCSASVKGNKVYVLNADTGAVLKVLSTDRPVAADVFVVPDMTSGLGIYAYVVDTGGNVYRITMGSSAASAWTINKIASLGCATTATCSAHRKFLFTPDVVKTTDGYIIMVGSGDREKPLIYSGTSIVNSVQNYFFQIADKPGDATWLTAESTNCGSAVLCLSSLLAIPINTTPTAAQLATKKGWYMALNNKEQVVTSALTIFGTTTFSTSTPPVITPGSCQSNLGTARVYNLNYENAASTNGTASPSEILPPVGLPPSPVGGMVTLDNGTTVPFCIGCDSTSPLEAILPPPPANSTPDLHKARSFWYIER